MLRTLIALIVVALSAVAVAQLPYIPVTDLRAEDATAEDLVIAKTVAVGDGLVFSNDLVLTLGTMVCPNSTTLPGTCVVGSVYMDTDAAAGSRWCLCLTTDNWTCVTGSGATSRTATWDNTGNSAGSVGCAAEDVWVAMAVTSYPRLPMIVGTDELGWTVGAGLCCFDVTEAGSNASNWEVRLIDIANSDAVVCLITGITASGIFCDLTIANFPADTTTQDLGLEFRWTTGSCSPGVDKLNLTGETIYIEE